MTILAQAEAIRDETQSSANTASRVGGCLADIAERLESPAIGHLYMVGNSTATAIVAPSEFVIIAGGMTDNNAVNNMFSHTTNRLTYIGAAARLFIVRLIATLYGNDGNSTVEIGVYDSALAAVDGDTAGRSMILAGADGSSQISVAYPMLMQTGDYVEAHITGDGLAGDEYVVTNLQMLVTEA